MGDVESVSLAAPEQEEGAEDAVLEECSSDSESRKSLFVEVANLGDEDGTVYINGSVSVRSQWESGVKRVGCYKISVVSLLTCR